MSKSETAADAATPAAQPAQEPAAAAASVPDAADWRTAISDSKLRAFADRMTSPEDAVKMAFDLRDRKSVV